MRIDISEAVATSVALAIVGGGSVAREAGKVQLCDGPGDSASWKGAHEDQFSRRWSGYLQSVETREAGAT